MGVIYQPVTDELYAARRGSGATLNGRRMSVSGLEDPKQALIEAGIDDTKSDLKNVRVDILNA